MNSECPGCGAAFYEAEQGVVDVGLHIEMTESETHWISYCPECSKKIMALDRDLLVDQVEVLVNNHLKPSLTTLSISEELVREIAGNLGASSKITDALVERIFGPNWQGAPPEDSGLVMNKYANRDRLVAFVAGKLKDLWTLEAQ
jgi:hypothetical protein